MKNVFYIQNKVGKIIRNSGNIELNIAHYCNRTPKCIVLTVLGLISKSYAVKTCPSNFHSISKTIPYTRAYASMVALHVYSIENFVNVCGIPCATVHRHMGKFLAKLVEHLASWSLYARIVHQITAL